MRRRFGQMLRIGVSARAVALVAASRFGRGQGVVLAEQRCADAAIDTIGATVRALLADAACDGWPTAIVVADDMARMWQVTPPPDSARLADLQAAAGLRFQHLYGEAPSAWQIAADYDSVRSFMAAALPRQLLALLAQAASAHRLRVVEINPQFVSSWNRWRRAVVPGAWYGLVHDNVLTLSAGGAPRALPLPLHADAAWLALQLEREALRLGVPAPAHLFVSGAVPPKWADNPACTVLGPALELSAAARLAATGAFA
ncbi:MAG: hypothetical protein ACLGI6_17225 [Gammaproteobacteria bacterium]